MNEALGPTVITGLRYYTRMDIFKRPPTSGKSLVSKNGAILVLLASLQHDLNQATK
jgi:hypothetical protein